MVCHDQLSLVGFASKNKSNHSGTITRRGVVGPMSRDVYEPTLHSLERENVKFTEKTL